MPEFGTPKFERPIVNRESVLEGKGLEEILRAGWNEYRAELTKISYGDVLDRTLSQSDKKNPLKAGKSSRVPEWVTREKNSQALLRAQALGQWFEDEEGKGDQSSFRSVVSNKKLEVVGKDIGAVEKRISRIYFSVLTQTAPEAFKSLFESLVDEGVMDSCEVALNFENYQTDSLSKNFETNTIILYVNQSTHTQIFEKIARAITRAKKKSPQDWEMPGETLTQAKEEMGQQFMVPLDETTGFVEVIDDGRSYHAGTLAAMYTEISGEWRKQLPLVQLRDKMKKYNPQTPGEFVDPSLKHRKKYMPALISD